MGISGLSNIANTGYSRTELKKAQTPVLFQQRQDKITLNVVGKNLKEGFSEGAVELWNQLKQPKNLLLCFGVTALGISLMTTLGLTFAASNFLILGCLTGLALFKTGKAIASSIKHTKNDQTNLAKKDIQDVGKSLFDLTVITAPFGAASLIKGIKYTDTFMELSSVIKGSKHIKYIAAGYDAVAKKIEIKLPLKKIPRSHSLENFINWKKHKISYPMKQTKAIRTLNQLFYNFNHWKTKFNIKAVEFIDNKLNLASLFKKNTPIDGSSAASLLKEVNQFRLAYPKAMDETISEFQHLGNVGFRFKCWKSIVKKFSDVKPENLAKDMKDIIGAEVIINDIKNFDELYGIIEKFAKEGRLIDVKNFHGKNNRPYLNFKKLEEIKNNNNNNFIVKPINKHLKSSGYKAVHIRLYEKTTGKPYEIQIKSKLMKRVTKYEHTNYKSANQEDHLNKKCWFRQLYDAASQLELGKTPRNKIILGQLYEITNNMNFKVTTIMNAIKKSIGLITLTTTDNKH